MLYVLRVAHVLRSTETHPDVAFAIGGWVTLPQRPFVPWGRFVQKPNILRKYHRPIELTPHFLVFAYNVASASQVQIRGMKVKRVDTSGIRALAESFQTSNRRATTQRCRVGPLLGHRSRVSNNFGC